MPSRTALPSPSAGSFSLGSSSLKFPFDGDAGGTGGEGAPGLVGRLSAWTSLARLSTAAAAAVGGGDLVALRLRLALPLPPSDPLPLPVGRRRSRPADRDLDARRPPALPRLRESIPFFSASLSSQLPELDRGRDGLFLPALLRDVSPLPSFLGPFFRPPSFERDRDAEREEPLEESWLRPL